MNRRNLIFAVALIIVILLASCKQEGNPTIDTTSSLIMEKIESIPGTTLPMNIERDDEIGIEEMKPGNTSEENGTGEAEKDTEAAQPTESVKPTEGAESTETTTPTEESEPAENAKPTESTEPLGSTDPTEAAQPEDGPCCAYGAYLEMSAAEQQAYMNTFSSPMAFIEWCKNAEAEHQAHDDSVVVEGGDLDIGDFIGGGQGNG